MCIANGGARVALLNSLVDLSLQAGVIISKRGNRHKLGTPTSDRCISAWTHSLNDLENVCVLVKSIPTKQPIIFNNRLRADTTTHATY